MPAWYGYLLVLDAVLYARRGESFVGGRGRELLRMMAWSIPFWLLFEAYNVRLHNWYYVFGLRTLWGSALLSTLAFATVLPACFFHAELLATFGIPRERKGRPLDVNRNVLLLCGAGGIVCAVAPLLWPRLAFWMVWGATFGLEVLNYRSGAPSILRELEAGRRTLVARLLLAGAVWELLNFWARTKWIYTVPGFENWKLLEMPLAGFGGFPALALSGFAYFSFVTGLRGGRRRLAVAAAILFAVGASIAVLYRNVQSVRPLLSDLPSLDASAVRRLRAAGVPTPERLDRALRREGVAAAAVRTGVSEDVLERAGVDASLAVHKGMGVPAALLLEAAGVRSVAALASSDPDRLTARLARVAAERGEPPPRPEYVRVWIRAASADGRPRR